MLRLNGNSCIFPASETVLAGTKAVLASLRKLQNLQDGDLYGAVDRASCLPISRGACVPLWCLLHTD